MPLTDSNPLVDAVKAEARRFLANQWRYIGYQMFAFPHPVYPFDPVVVKAFRQFIDPTMIPLWLRHVWLSSTGGIQYFDYHLISYQDENWEKVEEDGKISEPHPDFKGVIQPGIGRTVRPRGYIEILHSKSKELAKAFSPKVIGRFWPLSMMHVHKYREITWENNKAERHDQAEADLEARRARIRAVDEYWQKESDYRWDHDWSYMKKNRDNLTAEEVNLVHQAALRQQLGVGHTLPS